VVQATKIPHQERNGLPVSLSIGVDRRSDQGEPEKAQEPDRPWHPKAA